MQGRNKSVTSPLQKEEGEKDVYHYSQFNLLCKKELQIFNTALFTMIAKSDARAVVLLLLLVVVCLSVCLHIAPPPAPESLPAGY